MLYHALVRDTLGAVEEMYRHFGLELSDAGRQAMAKYLTDNPRDSRPPHRFSVGSEFEQSLGVQWPDSGAHPPERHANQLPRASGAGNGTLDGGGGADTLVGGAGYDMFIADAAGASTPNRREIG